ncbi:unnamed protein product [Linum trigynum]|uniref:Uncharacterized protein n=1 Tax=Linum trigynum TaxID=586398 RepID=A0AAV2G5L9_9ROSI
MRVPSFLPEVVDLRRDLMREGIRGGGIQFGRGQCGSRTSIQTSASLRERHQLCSASGDADRKTLKEVVAAAASSNSVHPATM